MDALQSISASASIIADTKRKKKTAIKGWVTDEVRTTVLKALGRIDHEGEPPGEFSGKILFPVRMTGKQVTSIINRAEPFEAIIAMDPVQLMSCSTLIWKETLCFSSSLDAVIVYRGPSRLGFKRNFSKFGHVVMLDR